MNIFHTWPVHAIVKPETIIYEKFMMKREYPTRPIAAVGVVVFKNDQVLLIRRNKPPKSSEWSIPGGAQKLGEPLKETAMREVFEETAISIKNITLVDAVDYIKKDNDKNIEYHYSLIDYKADYQSGDIKAGDDAFDAKWVSLNELTEYNLWSETIKLIEKSALIKKAD